jgi:hypothetical protein
MQLENKKNNCIKYYIFRLLTSNKLKKTINFYIKHLNLFKENFC